MSFWVYLPKITIIRASLTASLLMLGHLEVLTIQRKEYLWNFAIPSRKLDQQIENRDDFTSDPFFSVENSSPEGCEYHLQPLYMDRDRFETPSKQVTASTW